MRKFLSIALLFVALTISAQSIETKFSKIAGESYKKEWRRFTLQSNNSRLKIETMLGTTIYYKIVELEEPFEKDSCTFYIYHCKENDKVEHTVVQVIPKQLKGHAIIFLDYMKINGREMPLVTYKTEIY